jgi:hypothetical protein
VPAAAWQGTHWPGRRGGCSCWTAVTWRGGGLVAGILSRLSRTRSAGCHHLSWSPALRRAGSERGPLVLAQAAGFAFLAAVSPTALLVAAVYLGSASPGKTMLFYLAGALVMTAVMGVIVILALRAGHLNQPHHRTPRYGLRLGLGVVAVAAGVVAARRKRKPPGSAKGKKKPSLTTRLLARPSPLTAFTVGLILFLPGATYIAAASVIATARTSGAVTAGDLALIVVIDVLCVWLPYVLYLIAPDPTTRVLKKFNNWLGAHGRVLVAGALEVAGVILVVNGILGLTGA